MENPNIEPEPASDSQSAWPRIPVDHTLQHGPFDIIGDVHGCYDELADLLAQLGYQVRWADRQEFGVLVSAPAGRKLVFVGDLVDRGPRIPDVLKVAMSAVRGGTALCVPGNHDDKLMRALMGRKVKIAHGLEESLEQIAKETAEFRRNVCEFIQSLPSHLMLDEGQLAVAHAGIRESMQGKDTKAIRDFAMYGATTGRIDEYGLPERILWAHHYQGAAKVVYGHTPIPRHVWINNTLNIDTGCVFGGALSALRYPEMDFVIIPAQREYAASKRPFVLELDAPPPKPADEIDATSTN